MQAIAREPTICSLALLSRENIDFSGWFDYCGDTCSSCGNPQADEVWFRLPDNDPNSEWLHFDWHDILCNDCRTMLVKVSP